MARLVQQGMRDVKAYGRAWRNWPEVQPKAERPKSTPLVHLAKNISEHEAEPRKKSARFRAPLMI
jgi:hypothetical protein